jgi:putative endonuclease
LRTSVESLIQNHHAIRLPAKGALAEDRALAYLKRQGLVAVERNYRCKGGEIDLIMRAADDTLVFVEVRKRGGRGFGGAAASITLTKQRRVLHAASITLPRWTGCRRAAWMWWRWTRAGSNGCGTRSTSRMPRAAAALRHNARDCAEVTSHEY